MVTSELSSVSVKDYDLQAFIMLWTWHPNHPQFSSFLRRSDSKFAAYRGRCTYVSVGLMYISKRELKGDLDSLQNRLEYAEDCAFGEVHTYLESRTAF